MEKTPKHQVVIMRYKLTAPLSHIGKNESTGSYFLKILTAWGEMPIVTANSFRGQARDSGALHLIETLNAKIDKEAFHALFSGGNLNSTLKNDITKAKKVREDFPFVSLFGGGLGDMIISGKMFPSNLYPICRESQEITGIESDVSWRKMLSTMEFTRMDDSKDDLLAEHITDIDVELKVAASTQMRYGVQYLAPGTELWQRILLTCNSIEYGAFVTCLISWLQTKPTLGGMANKGFGFFDLETNIGISLQNGKIEVSEDVEKIFQEYTNLIKGNMPDFELLKSAEVKKRGKKTDETAESDSEAI